MKRTTTGPMTMPVSLQKPEWHYLSLEVVLDAQFLADHKEVEASDVEVDYISLKTIISASLGKLYGLIGEASHLDILEISKTKRTKSIVRIQPQDKEKVINSLLAFTFNLSNYGGKYDVSCYVKVNKDSHYLGLVLDDDFI